MKEEIYLVIPTIRDLTMLSSWGLQLKRTHLIVVEDRKEKTISIPHVPFQSVHHYTWHDIDSEFGDNSWIFARHNAAIRTYGFWKAYQLGADIIMTIDDDCYPVGPTFIEDHLRNLQTNIPSHWVSTYPNPQWMYTRGFPYKNRNKIKTYISHGLWAGALDLDAFVERKLNKLLTEAPYPPMKSVIPFGYFYPLCSMNLAFRSEILPIMFFPMMGERPDGSSWEFDRYDDIWAGLFSKKIMDHLHMGVVNGSPFVYHKKASIPEANYKKERSGMKMNETLWKRVMEVELTAISPKDCYAELAEKIQFPKTPYFESLRKAMKIWANLFTQKRRN